ncbi:MAG: hypothetical protein RRB13_02440 [bacterium]|nr:hypothetical protein [bacterium]
MCIQGKIFKRMMLLVLIVLATPAQAIERRRAQFYTEESYMILPLPYSIPGIGSGLMGIGLLGNVGGTHADVYALQITGDATGTIAALEEVHLIPETLWVSYFIQDLSRAAINIYEKRGMDTQKDDYRLVEVNQADTRQPGVTLSLWERRIELSYLHFVQNAAVTKIYTPDEELISEFSPAYEFTSEATYMIGVLDYTDDKQDPRVGFRLDYTRSQSPATSEVNPDYYTSNAGASVYLPVGKASTWVFNYYQSDAVVTREGITDEAYIINELGFSCADSDTTCLATQADFVADYQAQRKYGTADSLGGQNRLRAYPQGRYQAAHMLYYGTEFRWNFNEEVTPFDWWIWKDVSTGLQLAFFYEAGTVAELKSDLGTAMRSSSGVGLRMVSGSGYVYRFDVASGQEGSNTTMIFAYPW